LLAGQRRQLLRDLMLSRLSTTIAAIPTRGARHRDDRLRWPRPILGGTRQTQIIAPRRSDWVRVRRYGGRFGVG
jgi:RNA polymerase sigma-70 factor, ECF subfamily